MSADLAALRHTFGGLLRTYVTAAQTVFDEEPDDLGAASPILVLSRAGRARPRLSMRGNQTQARIAIDCYFAASQGEQGYTAADSADVVDRIAQQIDTVIEANQVNNAGGWEAIAYDGESTIEFGIFNADGVPRFRERVNLIFSVFA